MPYLSPSTLTTDEQKLILRVMGKHPRDHVIISLALGTGLRLGEIVGLDVGDVYTVVESIEKLTTTEAPKGKPLESVVCIDTPVTWSLSRSRTSSLSSTEMASS